MPIKGLTFRVDPLSELGNYESIPMRYESATRVDVEHLTKSDGDVIHELSASNLSKDYDADPLNRPSSYSSQFDTEHWRAISAWLDKKRIAGTILALRSRDFNMLESRNDLGVVIDFRVSPLWTGQGVGRALWTFMEGFAEYLGLIELNVETQDTNVAACRFYRSMGCTLKSARFGEYGPHCDEAKIVWRKEIGR